VPEFHLIIRVDDPTDDAMYAKQLKAYLTDLGSRHLTRRTNVELFTPTEYSALVQAVQRMIDDLMAQSDVLADSLATLDSARDFAKMADILMSVGKKLGDQFIPDPRYKAPDNLEGLANDA